MSAAATIPSPSNEENIMIVLYYCYPPTSILPDQLKSHAEFHRHICDALNLGGRIRVSEEGINGVLSGTHNNLKEYERSLREELVMLVCGDQSIETNDEKDPTIEWLDMKYCHLRKDVPVEKQLFDSLSVKITREVVSLIEPVNENGRGGRNKGRARCRQRRKQRRKEKQRLEKLREINGDIVTAHEVNHQATNGENDSADAGGDEKPSSPVAEEVGVALLRNGQGGAVGPGAPQIKDDTNISELGVALPIEDWEKQTPAVHLSPHQWNEKLLQLSRENQDQKYCNIEQSTGGEAILLDTRNVYETKVGHFAVPNLATFFPNTRKFSSLPNALNTNEAAEALAGKRVFMYCTGGVRCERAGSYLRALSESNTGAWKDKERPKGIYQLHGGIQKYLESYGTEKVESTIGNETDHKDKCAPESNDDDDNATECLYRGKNFVFDPRRTDPYIGNGIMNNCAAAASNDQRVSLVGRCNVCSVPHDDYDNGHAPCEEKEARCCRCRVLVLVCNGCRPRVRCWGESESDDDNIMELFCGSGGVECIDEGNVAAKVETARF